MKKLSQILISRALTIKIRDLLGIIAIISHKLSWETQKMRFAIIFVLSGFLCATPPAAVRLTVDNWFDLWYFVF